MEHIAGETLLEYCDSNTLKIEERLQLFIELCEAVAYSHQKGILHRDIKPKPSNILVRNFDGVHSPTIIDFGVSSELDAILQRPEKQLLGTPEYMSPEHVAASNDLDARADIYSLGMVLFTLLVGKIPFKRSAQGIDSYQELVSFVEDFKVALPRRYFENLSNLRQNKLALQRGIHPTQLNKSLDYELDSIHAKATDKDRARRYSSVSELVDDVQRYLNSQPLVALENTFSYRAKNLWYATW